jgi:hypothetical protein
MFGILSNMLFVNNILRLPLLERIRVFCEKNQHSEQLNEANEEQTQKFVDSTDSDSQENHNE